MEYGYAYGNEDVHFTLASRDDRKSMMGGLGPSPSMPTWVEE